MIMSDVLFWFLIVLGFYLAFNSYWLLAAALFPNTVEQCRLRYAEKPVRSKVSGSTQCLLVLTANRNTRG